MNIEQYIQQEAAKFPDAAVLSRSVLADVRRGGVAVTADANDDYKGQITKLLEKMHLRRAPLQGRVPVPYKVRLGDHDAKLKAGVDPETGAPLDAVLIEKGRTVLYNPTTRVVYPLPVNDSVSVETN